MLKNIFYNFKRNTWIGIPFASKSILSCLFKLKQSFSKFKGGSSEAIIRKLLMRKKTKLIPGKTKKVISRQYYDVVKSGGKDALRSIIQRRHLKSGLHINMIATEITEAAFNRFLTEVALRDLFMIWFRMSIFFSNVE